MSNGTGILAPLVVENSGRWLGNDGTWSAFYIHVGTPAQHFHVLPSFNGQTVYIPIDKDCERFNTSDCGGNRGVEIWASRPSTGFHPINSSTWDEIGTFRVGLGANFGLSGNAVFGYDTAGLGTSQSVDGIKIEKHAIAAYASSDIWVGQLGLSQYALNMSETVAPHSFLSRLKEGGHIPSLSFGFQAGAPYRFTRIPGSLTLGGYDRSRASTPSLRISATSDIIVGFQRLTATMPNGTTTTLLSNAILTTIDTAVSELWLPPSICDAFASAFGLTYFEAADRYALTDAARSALLAAPLTFKFTVGGSLSGGETIDVEIPYAAFDLEAKYPIFAGPTRYFPLRRAANESLYALGRAFMQEVYLTVDWERDEFNISQAVFKSPMPESDIVTIQPKNGSSPLIPLPGQPSNDKLSAGAIAGIAIGSILLVVLLVGAGWWLWRRKQKAKADAEVADALPVDEKKDPIELIPEVVGDQPGDKKPVVDNTRTDLELEGHPRVISEMYASHGQSEMQFVGTERAVSNEIVEVEGTSPIYELPSPDEVRRGM